MGSILLVESDPDTRERLAPALREAKHEVLIAHTMRDAYLRVSEGGIDVVVVDAYDPRVGVVDLVRELDALPDTPPLVLVSGSPHAPEISARIGAAAFVPKPVEPGELVAILSRITGDLRPVRPVDEFGDEDPTGPARQFG